MVALSVSPRALPIVFPPMVPSTTAAVRCTVYDQYFSPVLGTTVDFTSTVGSVLPPQAVTDSNGDCFATYSGDASPELVLITASTS